MTLKNKVIVITGSSEGLGRALALQLAHEGAKIWAVARNQANLQTLVDELHAAKKQADFYVCDVTSEAEVKKCVEHILHIETQIDA